MTRSPVIPDDETVAPFVGIPAPDFQGLKDNAPAGTNVQLLTGDQATLKAWNNALADPNAAGVFFIGHAASTNPDATPFVDNSGINLANGTFNPKGGVDVKAQTVGIFACDSQDSQKLFKMKDGQALIGMSSGADGLTSTSGLSQAGYAAAKEIVNARGPDAAVAAANGALTNASKAMTVRAPNGQNVDLRANPMNVGDRVVRIH